jgi:plasmid stabilization system protein ParE
MGIRYRQQALADIDQINAYLESLSAVGARHVLQSIHDSIAHIGNHPLAAAKTDDPAIRVRFMPRYRYKIFYTVKGDSVEILHVRHASRRPWLGR